ncbi:MAG TPA: hypothetical protein VFC72_04315 [Corynebacterium sp.]|nr:hypothetical protein [Corynebacterium sp.]
MTDENMLPPFTELFDAPELPTTVFAEMLRTAVDPATPDPGIDLRPVEVEEVDLGDLVEIHPDLPAPRDSAETAPEDSEFYAEPDAEFPWEQVPADFSAPDLDPDPAGDPAPELPADDPLAGF